MALITAGLHGALSYNVSRAGKINHFGNNFKVRIIVDDDYIKPFKQISGKVVIETRFPIKHKDIIIQFEGLCQLRYSTKFDSRTTFHQDRKSILENTKLEIEGYYQESPVRYVILDYLSTPTDWGYHTMTKTEIFPFTLEIPGNPHLPAPFKTQFGSLVYRLVVYMKSTNYVYVEVGKKIMRFNGHHNLLENIEALKPNSIENSYKKSLFTTKKLVETVFSIECSGYLPEERIPFILYVKNAKLIPLELVVQLVQHLKYDANNGKRGSSKNQYCVVSQIEKENFEPEPELTWMDSLHVRDDQEPSFSAHHMHNVAYSLQFKVKILNQGAIKGELPIYIGTTREPNQILMSNANGLDVPFSGLRRGSASSTHSVRSHDSASTTYSLPPAYSQLSSRIPSVETLPPGYDEAEQSKKNQNEGNITIQVPSMPSTEGDLADTSENEED